MTTVVPPTFDHGDRFFWEGAEAGRLLLQRCDGCGTLRNPPRPMCGVCQSLEWTAVDASGRGTIQSWIASHHPNEPDAPPRIVILVDLEEGLRLVSNLVDATPDEVDNGAPVELCFRRYGDVTLPQFRLVRS